MRVAIYAAPGALATDASGGALRQRAESWLGRSATGAPVEPAAPAGWTRAEVDAITVDARRYGFHATLKAPFRLAEGRSLDALEREVAAFAAARPPIELPELRLARIGSFFALVPGAPAEPLSALAAELVRGFDGFRAAPTEVELARRNPSGMTARQRELFEQWGYPYVLDEFRFHLTLTDRIAPERQAEVERVLADWFARGLARSIRLDCIALFTESEPGAPFELHSTHPLLASTELPDPARVLQKDSAR
jgi:putative phosphonate metabolism protein